MTARELCKECGHLQRHHVPNGGCGARRSVPGGRTYRCDCSNFVSSLIELDPVGRHGRKPIFAAKIGTMGSSCVIVKGASEKRCGFAINQRIEFADTSDMHGMSVGVTPKWLTGRIWLIENNRLFINRV
jgi:hypothetical protein